MLHRLNYVPISYSVFFFFNDTATTEIYTTYDTLSLHDALPILGLVHAAQRAQALLQLRRRRQLHRRLLEDRGEPNELLAWQPVRRRRGVTSDEYLQDVHQRVPGNGERQLGLGPWRRFDAGEDQRAGVEDRGERREPGLVAV